MRTRTTWLGLRDWSAENKNLQGPCKFLFSADQSRSPSQVVRVRMSRVESESRIVGLDSESNKIGTRVRVQESPSLSCEHYFELDIYSKSLQCSPLAPRFGMIHSLQRRGTVLKRVLLSATYINKAMPTNYLNNLFKHLTIHFIYMTKQKPNLLLNIGRANAPSEVQSRTPKLMTSCSQVQTYQSHRGHKLTEGPSSLLQQKEVRK